MYCQGSYLSAPATDPNFSTIHSFKDSKENVGLMKLSGKKRIRKCELKWKRQGLKRARNRLLRNTWWEMRRKAIRFPTRRSVLTCRLWAWFGDGKSSYSQASVTGCYYHPSQRWDNYWFYGVREDRNILYHQRGVDRKVWKLNFYGLAQKHVGWLTCQYCFQVNNRQLMLNMYCTVCCGRGWGVDLLECISGSPVLHFLFTDVNKPKLEMALPIGDLPEGTFVLYTVRHSRILVFYVNDHWRQVSVLFRALQIRKRMMELSVKKKTRKCELKWKRQVLKGARNRLLRNRRSPVKMRCPTHRPVFTCWLWDWCGDSYSLTLATGRHYHPCQRWGSHRFYRAREDSNLTLAAGAHALRFAPLDHSGHKPYTRTILSLVRTNTPPLNPHLYLELSVTVHCGRMFPAWTLNLTHKSEVFKKFPLFHRASCKTHRRIHFWFNEVSQAGWEGSFAPGTLPGGLTCISGALLLLSWKRADINHQSKLSLRLQKVWLYVFFSTLSCFSNYLDSVWKRV